MFVAYWTRFLAPKISIQKLCFRKRAALVARPLARLRSRRRTIRFFGTERIEPLKKYRQIQEQDPIEDDVGQRFRRVQLSGWWPYDRCLQLRGIRMTAALADGTRIYRHDNLTSQSGGPTTSFPIILDGHEYSPGRSYWKTNSDGITRLKKAARIAPSRRAIRWLQSSLYR